MPSSGRLLRGKSMASQPTPRQLFRDCVTFADGARPLLCQRNWLMPGVEEDWLREGATPQGIDDLFAFSDPRPVGIDICSGIYPPFEGRVIHEDDEFLVQTNELGGVEKLNKGYASIPLPVEFPVGGADDWAALRERYLWTPERLGDDWAARARQAVAQGYALQVGFGGYFGFPRRLLGDECLCLAYYDEPDLVRDMCETNCALMLGIADEIEEAGIEVDSVFFWEDMAGKQGSLVGPRTFREFMMPYYQQVTRRFRELGAYHCWVDSDGNLEGLTPLFLESGITCLFPFECRAGNDIVAFRQRYPNLVIHGGIDKLILAQGREAIDREIDRKLPPMIAGGGYLCAADHRIVRGTTYADMRHFVERVAQMVSE